MSLVGAIVTGVISFVVGIVAITAGARLVLDSDTGFGRAAITALIGALVWALFSFVQIVPLIGTVLMLVLWIAVINFQYPGGWGTAAGIGLVAWVVAVGAVYLLAVLLSLQVEVFGIPGV